MRLTLKLTNELVLPLKSYDALLDYFTDGVTAAGSIGEGPIGVIQDLLKDRDQKVRARRGRLHGVCLQLLSLVASI